jgi:hypothetical protein
VFPRNVVKTTTLLRAITQNTISSANSAIRARAGMSAYVHTSMALHTVRRIEGKGNAIPLQALTGPEGSRRLRLQDFRTIGT